MFKILEFFFFLINFSGWRLKIDFYYFKPKPI